MQLELIIPTLGRCDNQITLKSIPEKYHSSTTLVVQEHEYDYMRKKYPNVNVWKLPSGTKGIAMTRKVIAQNWKNKRVWIMDDDLRFVTINSELKGNTSTELEFDKIIETINRFMDEGYIHGGLSTHNTPPQDKEFSFNTRIYTNVFYSENLDPDAIDWGESYVLMPEDFYVTLQLLTTGHKNVVFNWLRVNPSPTNSKGGCESYRTLDNHNRGQEILAEKFPEFVEVYQKEQTSGPWKGMQKNALKIKWKQAYESSQRSTASLESFFGD